MPLSLVWFSRLRFGHLVRCVDLTCGLLTLVFFMIKAWTVKLLVSLCLGSAVSATATRLVRVGDGKKLSCAPME